MKRMLIFGLGYTAGAIAQNLTAQGWHVDATGRAGNLDFADEDAVRAAITRADAILSSVPPTDEMDPVLTRYSDALGEAAWLGYLSSTGVYGDCGGAWVDETAPVAGMGGTGRRTARALADAAWLDLGARVLRLPGIYGPGRSAFDRLRSGRAHRVDMPNQIFSRIHVEDIASATLAALAAPPGAYNIADDIPAPKTPSSRKPAGSAASPCPDAGPKRCAPRIPRLLCRKPKGGQWQGPARIGVEADVFRLPRRVAGDLGSGAEVISSGGGFRVPPAGVSGCLRRAKGGALCNPILSG
jgi:hypothetical protein